MSPLSTFSTSNGDVKYVDYYKQHYNIKLNDLKQPLLVSRKERRVSGKEKPEELLFCLVPEVCHLAGLQSETRSDMRELATHTKIIFYSVTFLAFMETILQTATNFLPSNCKNIQK